MKKIGRIASFFLVLVLVMVYGFVGASGGDFALFDQSLDAVEYKQTVEFGTYEYNGATVALRWEVVESDLADGTATLLLKEAIPGLFLPFNNGNYNEDGANVWAGSFLNTYLNTTFFEEAFTESDREKLIELSTGTHVTIPSAAEYYSWYYEPTERVGHVGSTYNWWLRDPGQAANYNAVAMYVVKGAGRVVQVGALVNTLMAVRPVIKVDNTVADMLKTYEPPTFTTATVGGASVNLGLGVVEEDFNEFKTGGLLENLRGSVTLTEDQAEAAMANFALEQGWRDYRLSLPTDSPSTAAAQDGINGKWYARTNGTVENTLTEAGEGCYLKDADVLVLQLRDFSDDTPAKHVYFWVDITVEPAVEWPIRVDSTLPAVAVGSIAEVAVADIPVQLGAGLACGAPADATALLGSLNALRSDKDLFGNVVITQSEAQNAAFTFNKSDSNDSLRAVIVSAADIGNDSRWSQAATTLRGEDSRPSPQTVLDGDVLVIYQRSWGIPQMVYYVVINVVPDIPPSP